MESDAWAFVILGVFLLAGYGAYVGGPRIHIPRVTVLLLLGVVSGSSVLGLVPESVSEWMPFVSHMALGMVGFLLGESFVGKQLKEKGRVVIWISIGETLFAALLVFAALAAIGTPLVLCLLLAGIAPASAPAAILETIREGKAKGSLSDTLLGVVAIDDAWGVILFSILFVVAQGITGASAESSQLLAGLWEVFGAVAVGAVLGFPMAYLSGRVRKGEPALLEALGFVFLTSGIASVLEVSYLLSAMVLGAVVANWSRHHTRPFHSIDGVSEPFLAVFFILAGLKFEPETLAQLGLVGCAYIIARAAGLMAGGWTAGKLSNAPAVVQSRIGACLLPQAGVALGFALLVEQRLPDVGKSVLPLVIGTTVLFEITGPIVARWQLRRAGEITAGSGGGGEGG
jgi:Kef-type K+ transport system membrane component KefB